MINLNEKIQIKFIDLEPIPKIAKYLNHKLDLDNSYADSVKDIQCKVYPISLNDNKSYYIDGIVRLNNAGFIIKAKSAEIFELIDKFAELLHKRLMKISEENHASRYSLIYDSKHTEIIKKSEVKNTQGNNDLENELVHSIVEKSKISYDTPLSLSEAIQLMELQGKQLFMFRNIQSG